MKDPSRQIDELDKIFSNSLRVDILLQLIAHNVLTLTEITEMMGKSKSAMSRQMKQLVEYEMIEEMEMDLNNPGSPQKGYTISEDFVKKFMHTRQKEIFFDRPDLGIYISYMVGMLAISQRMDELTKDHLESLGNKKSRDLFVDKGILMINSRDLTEVLSLLQNFIQQVQEISKTSPSQGETKDTLIEIGIYPFQEMLAK